MGPNGEGIQVIDELQPMDQDIQIYKRYLSGFSHNDLDYTMRTMGIKRVLIDRQHNTPYYQIGWKATWAMGVAYVLLGGFLAVMTFLPVIETIVGGRGGRL